MNQNLSPLIDSFAGLRVLVIGDAMLDVYLHGTTNRLCREAPVPIVTTTHREEALGGAANTAANVRALGGQARLLAALGDDQEGRRLRALLNDRAIQIEDQVTVGDRATLTKSRIVVGSQMLLRFDQGDTTALPAAAEAELLERLDACYAWCDAVIISDYSYGVVSPALLHRLTDLRQASPRPLVADGKDLALYQDLQPTAIKPNYEELIRLLGAPPAGAHRIEAVASFGERVLEVTGASIAAVTLDREGALVFERGRPPHRTYAHPVSDSRAAGAGDTFVAALTLALAAGAETPAAAEIASAAANIVVTKDGTSICDAEELRDSMEGSHKLTDSLSKLALRVDLCRHQGKRIVFTNGCFDIIHSGHIAYLSAAKSLGDTLIVGVNSDASVSRLKGPDRPINCLEDRVQILAALSCVDYIVPFEQDSPVQLIEVIRPDVFVKGGDYTRETLPEAPLVESLGGVVELLPYVEEHSTTGIISKIRAAASP